MLVKGAAGGGTPTAHADPLVEREAHMVKRTCTYEGCDRPLRARGYCVNHYDQYQRRGWTWDPIPRPTVEQRFWAKVDKNGPVSDELPRLGKCWLWTGAISGTGYGTFNCGDHRWMSAHRFAYRLLVGPVPKGLELDHLCRVRACLNPSHLESVTHVVNTMRGDAPGAVVWRTNTCQRGHSLADAYTANRGDGTVTRTCRTCAKAAWLRNHPPKPCLSCVRCGKKLKSSNTSGRCQQHKGGTDDLPPKWGRWHEAS